MKKAVFIDAVNREIRDVMIGNHYREIQKILNCSRFTSAFIKDPKNSLYIDDAGMFDLTDKTGFFRYGDGPQPFAGNGLIIGMDDEGRDVDTNLQAGDVRKLVTFLSYADVRNSVNY